MKETHKKTMKSILKETLELFRSNIILFSAIILTVCLPINIITNIFEYYQTTDDDLIRSLKAYVLMDGVLSPVYMGALIYAVFNIKQGKSITYARAMSAGVKNWFDLFVARFVAGIIILFGLLLFVVPGIILMVRYALLDSVVIVEQVGHSQARKRSNELTLNWRFEIFITTILMLVCIFIITTVLYSPLFFFDIPGNIFVAVFLDCITDILFSSLTVILFLIYWESVNNKTVVDDNN